MHHPLCDSKSCWADDFAEWKFGSGHQQNHKYNTKGRARTALAPLPSRLIIYTLTLTGSHTIAFRRFSWVFLSLQVFVANRDANSVVTLSVQPTVDTRLIRIVPGSWTGSLCVRMEFYGCPYGMRESICFYLIACTVTKKALTQEKANRCTLPVTISFVCLFIRLFVLFNFHL